jgi:hypothetical protein
MRFAGDLIRQGNPNDTISPESADEVYRFQKQLRDKPIVPSFNSEDLQMTPEMTPGPYFPGQDLMRDRYIRQNPGSGVAMLPNGEQGPSQGPNTPIKNYGGVFMPKGSEPSGYRPGPRKV